MVHTPYLLAMVLLSNPPGAADPPGLEAHHGVLQKPLQQLAVQMEILDSREFGYILARPEDFATDLHILRHRFHELANAPNVDDAARFPERAIANDLLAFNRAYRQHIDVRQPIELVHWWELRTALQETEHLYQVWDKVREARCDYYHVTVRRQALKSLRELVGDEAYYTAELPPAVPVWRFRSDD